MFKNMNHISLRYFVSDYFANNKRGYKNPVKNTKQTKNALPPSRQKNIQNNKNI